jgi:electron transport complex protein RnfD
MDNKFYNNLTVSSSPHLVTSLDTSKTMMMVLIALAPAFIMSVIVFGVRAIILTAVCVVASAFFEWAYSKLMHKPNTVGDLSACVTGAILAMNLPSNFPYWMAIIGCFVAIVIVKCLFGGLGRNIANPAIVGRIVLLLSFTTQMTTWPVPRQAQTDATTGATALGVLQEVVKGKAAVGDLPTNSELFLGFVGGSMGEVSALAILIGGCFLIWKKIISPAIPVSFIGAVFVFSLIYYGVKGGDYNALHMAIFHVCAGGVMFGAFFCATDYVTSPIMTKSRIIYGILCGVITMIIRLFASYPEGVSFAILFMNMCTPLLDDFVIKRTYGGAKKNEK